MRYLILITCLFPISLAAQSPEELAFKISNNFKSKSSFEIVDQEIDPVQNGLLTMNPKDGKAYDLETIVTVNERGRFFIAFAASPGILLVKMDEQTVFEGRVETNGLPRALDDGKYKPDGKILVPPFQGDYTLTFRHFPDDESSVYVWLIDEKGVIRPTIDFRSDIDFIEPSPYRYRLVSTFDVSTGDWQYPGMMQARFHDNPMKINDWQYHNGVNLDALWQASEHFSSIDHRDFVTKHLDFFVDQLQLDGFEGPKLVEGSFHRYYRYRHLDDFGPQSMVFLNPPEKDEYIRFVRKALNRMLYRAIRSSDGTFARYAPDSLTVKAEDLYMSTVLLNRAYTRYNKRQYLEQAISQVILFNQKLKDQYTGLYWHGYSTEKKEHNSVLWARANGWVALAHLELMKAIPPDHPEFESMLRIFRNHIQGIIEKQSEDGRWYQVMDNEESYLETSASALFITAIAEGLNRDWLFKEEYRRAVIRAWLSLIKQVDQDGNINGISEETSVMFSDADYINRLTIENDPIGIGPFIYACIAMDKLNQKSN